jgi:MFS family permease
MMMAHMLGASVDIDIAEELIGQMDGKIKISIGSVIYLIIPFAALFIGGFIYSKQSVAANIREKLYGAIGIGVFYGLFLAVMTFFSGISLEQSVEEFSMKLAVNYSFLGALFMGLILGSLFSILGILSTLGKFKTTGHLPGLFQYGQAIHQGISAVWRGLLISFAVMTIIVMVLGSTIKEDMMFELPFLEESSWGAIVLLIGIQLGYYFWHLFTLGTINLTAFIEGETEGFSYSLLTGLAGKGEEFVYLMSDMETFDLIIKFGIIIPILLFIWAGYKIGFKSSTSGTALHIAVFSLVFAVISAFLVSITNFNLSMSGTFITEMMGEAEPSVQFGYSMMAVFIKSFLFSFAAAFTGAYVNKVRNQ